MSTVLMANPGKAAKEDQKQNPGHSHWPDGSEQGILSPAYILMGKITLGGPKQESRLSEDFLLRR